MKKVIFEKKEDYNRINESKVKPIIILSYKKDKKVKVGHKKIDYLQGHLSCLNPEKNLKKERLKTEN